jgi:predicted nucleic acid-binding protein
LDTSCALNFLGVDQDADEALGDLVGAAMAGRVHLRVSASAFEEVERVRDQQTREQRLKRLRAFGRIEVASHQVALRDRIATDLHETLFPNAERGSRTDEHNRRDCRQLATHAVAGRSVFCTLDRKLLRRAAKAASHRVRIASPATVLQEIEADSRSSRLPSPASVSVRDAVIDQDGQQFARSSAHSPTTTQTSQAGLRASLPSHTRVPASGCWRIASAPWP